MKLGPRHATEEAHDLLGCQPIIFSKFSFQPPCNIHWILFYPRLHSLSFINSFSRNLRSIPTNGLVTTKSPTRRDKGIPRLSGAWKGQCGRTTTRLHHGFHTSSPIPFHNIHLGVSVRDCTICIRTCNMCI